MKTVCVYCGSRMGRGLVYREAARALGVELVRQGLNLVYGGGDVGLMGVVARAVMREGGQVIGVIPQVLMNRELGLDEVSELIVVDSMHERKMKMSERADGFIAMPGGIGTFEELFEIITWGYLGLHRKPVGIYNVQGFYDKMLDFLEHVEGQGFLHKELVHYLVSDGNPRALLGKLASQTPPEVETIIEKEEQK